MDQTVTTIIDRNLCNGCGLCITVCPKETISMQNGKACVTGNESLSCGHCSAICPKNAITVSSLDESMTYYKTFKQNNKWIRHGDFDTGKLVNLIRSRRSCRNYKTDPIDKNTLEDLVKIGITAPSGSNVQGWTFTILQNRKDVIKLINEVYGYYKKLNLLAEKKLLRFLLKITGKNELDFYYNNYFKKFKEKISGWENSGRDSLFFGAVSVIIIAYKPDASCPAEDALLASQNILLAAHSMGIGSCLNGYAVSAIKRNPQIKKTFGIPMNENVYAVIALGHPSEKYLYQAGRKKAEIRFYKP